MRSAKFLGMAFLIGILVLTGCTRSPAPTKNSETGQATANTEAQASDITPLFSRHLEGDEGSYAAAFREHLHFSPEWHAAGNIMRRNVPHRHVTLEKDALRELRVVEDRQPAFTARIEELTNTSLRLQRRLARGNTAEELSLTAVEGEFVCPDMPK
jgi:hypothetical protein